VHHEYERLGGCTAYFGSGNYPVPNDARELQQEDDRVRGETFIALHVSVPWLWPMGLHHSAAGEPEAPEPGGWCLSRRDYVTGSGCPPASAPNVRGNYDAM